jgi:predicted RNA-binding Zn-ribbon protein involved in translation (DUF1610 family)
MALHKCPRCELNYAKDAEKYCDVCKREIKGEKDAEALPDTCPECGERPVVPGEELCILCLRERRRQETLEKLSETELLGESLELDEVADLEDIEVPATSDIPPSELQEIDKELGIDDKELFVSDDGALLSGEGEKDEDGKDML